MGDVVRTDYWPEKEIEWWKDEVCKLKRTLSEYSLEIERLRGMDLPKRSEEPGMQVGLRLDRRILERIDDVRGRLNRQQWIRKVIIEALAVVEGDSQPVRPPSSI